jgi:hypothetical protein
MDLFTSQSANLVTMADQSSTDSQMSVQDKEKKERLELIAYVKAHLDLISVTLLVAYLSYTLYKMKTPK